VDEKFILANFSSIAKGTDRFRLPFLWFISFGGAKEPTEGSSAKPNEQTSYELTKEPNEVSWMKPYE
jgi:hypothetical protein